MATAALLGIDRSGRVRRIAWRVLALSAALVPLGWIAMLTGGPTPCLFSFTGMLGVIGAGVTLAFASSMSPRFGYGTFELGSDGLALTIAGEPRRVRREELADGWVEERADVHLRLRSGETVIVRAEETRAAEALLAALGLDARKRVLRAELSSPAERVSGGRALAIAGLFFLVPASLFVVGVLFVGLADLGHRATVETLVTVGLVGLVNALACLGLYGLVYAVRPGEVVIGTDGVAIRRAFRSERVPYATVESVVDASRGVELRRRDERPPVMLWTCPLNEPPLGDPQRIPKDDRASAQRRGLVAERIREAIAAGGESEARARFELLDRGGRSLEDWRRALTRLASGVEAGYRGVSLSPAELGAIVEDGTAPVERRIAAVVALASSNPDDAKKRVRVAVESSADEDLQRALEEAAEGEIDEALLAKTIARGH